MLFNSLEFLLFFPIVTLLYFILPHKFRWGHLLAASCLFYAAFVPIYILILFFTIVIDYFAGIWIEQAPQKRKKFYLILSLVANIGVLAVFKYYNFFIDNINLLLDQSGSNTTLPFLSILLPIGLSFHTFQAMSYTIEVYYGNQKAEKHFGIYALYVMFYPQLVAGPIERPQNVLYQFYQKHSFNYSNVTDGLKLMMWGMFKKVVIADRLAIYTDPIFNDPQNYPGISLAIGTFLFTFQIYCDFSGYSDIALGSARVMGFKLIKNFDRPYSSQSISEFWSRWHISLSTWFKDYLYIPLGGNRVSIPRWYFNLFFVFLVSGFWHGANWTFILWGALHGVYLILAIVILKFRKAPLVNDQPNWFKSILNISITFILVAFAWIFFRANSISDAFYIIAKIPDSIHDLIVTINTKKIAFWNIWGLPQGSLNQFLLCFLLIAFLNIAETLHARYNLISLLKKQAIYVRWAIYYTGIISIYLLGVYEERQFIYFQF
jgi:alginate O-acetyltransferase complex protein AlgI